MTTKSCGTTCAAGEQHARAIEYIGRPRVRFVGSVQFMPPNSPWPKTVHGVILRDARPADVEVIAGFRNLPEVNTWNVVTSESRAELDQRWLGAAASETEFSCAAEVAGEIVGIGYLELMDGIGQPGMPERTEAVIGYLVRPECSGRGVGTAIAMGLLEACFAGLGVRRVTAGCFAKNTASARILEKVGMRREQHGHEDSWHAELGWIDGYTYAMLRQEWDAGVLR